MEDTAGYNQLREILINSHLRLLQSELERAISAAEQLEKLYTGFVSVDDPVGKVIISKLQSIRLSITNGEILSDDIDDIINPKEKTPVYFPGVESTIDDDGSILELESDWK